VDSMVVEPSFRSEETFSQVDFRCWLDRRPAADVHRYELIRGRIVMSPPSGAHHGHVGSEINGLLREHVKTRGLGLLFDASTGFELPSGDTLEPAVAFVSRERWEAGPRPAANDFLRIVPVLVVEILSPSTERRDRTEKLEIYARNGVDECWLVDVQRREITVLPRTGGVFARLATASAGRIPSRVLPQLDAHVEDVFADLD